MRLVFYYNDDQTTGSRCCDFEGWSNGLSDCSLYSTDAQSSVKNEGGIDGSNNHFTSFTFKSGEYNGLYDAGMFEMGLSLASIQEDNASQTHCVNDDSASDNAGDTCSSWYDSYPSSCGNYDTLGFTASEYCCACGGGIRNTVTEESVAECSNDDSTGDSGGDTCTEWYDSRPSTCGNYDTNDFSANLQCCACGGGIYESSDNTPPDSQDNETGPQNYGITGFVVSMRSLLVQAGCDDSCIDSILIAPQNQI